MKMVTMKMLGTEEVLFRINYSIYGAKAAEAAKDLQTALGLEVKKYDMADDDELIIWVEKK